MQFLGLQSQSILKGIALLLYQSDNPLLCLLRPDSDIFYTRSEGDLQECASVLFIWSHRLGIHWLMRTPASKTFSPAHIESALRVKNGFEAGDVINAFFSIFLFLSLFSFPNLWGETMSYNGARNIKRKSIYSRTQFFHQLLSSPP